VLADVIAVVLAFVGAVSEGDTAFGAGVVAVTGAGAACAVDVAGEVVGTVTGAGAACAIDVAGEVVGTVTGAGAACAIDVAGEVVGTVTGAGTMTGGYFLGQ
jgi:hypothetical protein